MEDTKPYRTILAGTLLIFVCLLVATPTQAQVPIGSILPFYGNENQKPAGWLFCNGGEVSRRDYPLLHEHLIVANPALRDNKHGTVRLPDLRGEFLRGLDVGRGVDVDRILGTSQPFQAGLPPHDHELSQAIGRSEGWCGGWGTDCGHRAVNGPGDRAMIVGEAKIQRETRPRNIAVNFIIKAVP